MAQAVSSSLARVTRQVLKVVVLLTSIALLQEHNC